MNQNKNRGRQGTGDTTGKAKISQSDWAYAGDYIRMGDSLEQRQSHLNGACSAWNLACNTPELRRKHLDHYMREYSRVNRHLDEGQIADVRSNMEKLIEKKLAMFPNDLRQIVDARIVKVGDKERIEVVGATLQ
jgi:hypothetical protein